MNIFLLSLLVFFIFSKQIFANPACAVCTVAIGATLTISRKLGISDNIVAIWSGAFLALVGYWAILWCDKKNIHFFYRNKIIMLLSFSMIGTLYIKSLIYSPEVVLYIFYIDKFLFYSIIGMLIYIYSLKFYSFLKKLNNNKAHFPFEKVFIPLFMLTMISIIVYYFDV